MDRDQEFWETKILERYEPGQIVTARITTITRFGILVELEPGVEGAVHVSELTELPSRNIHEIVKVGEELELQILAVDFVRRKIGLSRRSLGK
jgi:small subunit ribosomal protein S1